MIILDTKIPNSIVVDGVTYAPNELVCDVDLIICLHDTKLGVEKAGLSEKTVVVDIGLDNSKTILESDEIKIEKV